MVEGTSVVFEMSLVEHWRSRQFIGDLAMHGKCQATFSAKYSSRSAFDND